METNVLGVLNAIHPILPQMMARGKGHIGIVSSIAAFIPLPDAPSYSASKSAILTYGLALRSALRQSGIGVSVICPGYVDTPMMEQESGPKPSAMSAQSAAVSSFAVCSKTARSLPFRFGLLSSHVSAACCPIACGDGRPSRFASPSTSENKTEESGIDGLGSLRSPLVEFKVEGGGTMVVYGRE